MLPSETGVAKRACLVDAAANLVHNALGDLEQMLFVAELDRRDLELTLALHVGLVGAVDHDVANRRIREQLFEWAEPEKLVDEHLFQRELLAAVEGDLELGKHFRDDWTKFLGKLVLVQRCRSFRVDTFEKSREDLFLDSVNRSLKAFDFAGALFAARVLARGEAVHCRAQAAIAAWLRDRSIRRRGQLVDGRELLASLDGRSASRAALHWLGDAEGGA